MTFLRALTFRAIEKESIALIMSISNFFLIILARLKPRYIPFHDSLQWRTQAMHHL